MDALIFDTLSRINAEEDTAKRDAMKRECNADLGSHFSRHPSELEELAYDLLNIAWSDAMVEDIVPQIIEVKTVGLGEPDFVDEDLRGLRAYWQGKGGQILSDIIRYERTVMPREEMVTALDFHQDEINLDFWGTFDKLVGQAQEKIRQLPVTRLIELIQASIQGGTFFGSFALSTLTATQVDSVLEEVALRSDGDVSILGTRTAVRHLSNIGLTFGINVAERIFNTGQVGQYKGYPVVQVENFEDFAGNFVLPNNELWLVGKRAGRLTYFGDTAKVQQLQKEAFYRRWETGRDAGMLLYGAQRGRIGRIVLT
jgi:hypothetical protein